MQKTTGLVSALNARQPQTPKPYPVKGFKGKDAMNKDTRRKRSEQNQPSPRLKARALAIINSDKYDRDTRESIAFQLKTNYSDLADMVRDAEKGVTICDIVMVREHQSEAARQVLALINESVAPDFLTTAMMVALQQAAAIKEINLWTATANETEELNADALADLFAVTQRLSLPGSELDSAPTLETDTDPRWIRLASAVSEIVTNPATPVGLYNEVMGFLNSEGGALWGKLMVTPTMIQKILIEARLSEEVSNAEN